MLVILAVVVVVVVVVVEAARAAAICVRGSGWREWAGVECVGRKGRWREVASGCHCGGVKAEWAKDTYRNDTEVVVVGHTEDALLVLNALLELVFTEC